MILTINSLNIASSEIIALLLPNGKTTYLKFKIFLNIDEDSLCSIPLANKYLRNILRYSNSYNVHLSLKVKIIFMPSLEYVTGVNNKMITRLSEKKKSLLKF
ncbi:hypothetical protein Ahy_B06g080776 [Arachis hypogaea]|uniref:ATP-dependent DNA helicase n=1 Tax=Arachis hypogaea TaxID=3818 RepID=A0A444YIZ7_ARAHY|nr:hypothetical protein Ahy_B06g080776 [Arachis hypogaea]